VAHRPGNTDTGTSYVLAGQLGHIYTIRARPWQNKATMIYMVMVEKQVQVGGAFAGYVRNHFGGCHRRGYLGREQPHQQRLGRLLCFAATRLRPGVCRGCQRGGYGAPLPISASVAGQTSVTSITFTLKPADDAISNGDFESDTSGWNKSGRAARLDSALASAAARPA